MSQKSTIKTLATFALLVAGIGAPALWPRPRLS